ncbi:DAK2 domain-containing protein [Candidatus Sodalis pierantonius]|nr:DAK2 domain-containing protein [Candidatus Sodalis pierantonius]
MRATLEETLAAFQQRPNRIGRARMFAERSIGLDDPGQVALLRMVEAL